MDWQASFTDYLYLAFTTSTAFSPSEVYPFTNRAKILHNMQSLISLLTVVALAARAINVLGKITANHDCQAWRVSGDTNFMFGPSIRF